MSNLLLELQGNNFINRTIFPHRLFLFNDILLYKKRKFLRRREVTIAYSHISQVNLVRGIIFATIEIISTGSENIILRGIPKDLASRAKKIIDQKIFMEHAKHIPDHSQDKNELLKYDKSIQRLKELFMRGKLSKKEYNERHRELLEDM